MTRRPNVSTGLFREDGCPQRREKLQIREEALGRVRRESSHLGFCAAGLCLPALMELLDSRDEG